MSKIMNTRTMRIRDSILDNFLSVSPFDKDDQARFLDKIADRILGSEAYLRDIFGHRKSHSIAWDGFCLQAAEACIKAEGRERTKESLTRYSGTPMKKALYDIFGSDDAWKEFLLPLVKAIDDDRKSIVAKLDAAFGPGLGKLNARSKLLLYVKGCPESCEEIVGKMVELLQTKRNPSEYTDMIYVDSFVFDIGTAISSFEGTFRVCTNDEFWKANSVALGIPEDSLRNQCKAIFTHTRYMDYHGCKAGPK